MRTAQSWNCFIFAGFIAVTSRKPDVHVTCRFAEDCVLPCQFEAVGDEIIYWFRQNVLIHTYKQASRLPDRIEANKASLFSQRISNGSASLHLQKTGPRDRGKYMCVVTSARETSQQFIIVKVEAPIHSVQLEITRLSGFEEVKCFTRKVYPAPRITLYTEPAAAKPERLHHYTHKTADTHGLYMAESKLRKLQGLTYICLIQSFYSSQTWRSSLLETEIIITEGQDFTIPCIVPWSLQNFTLTWSIFREHNSSILYMFDSLTQQSSNHSNETVDLEIPGVESGDGSLRILSPQRLEHSGIYTCILSAPQIRHQLHATVSIIPKTANIQSVSAIQWWIPVTVITALAGTAVAIFLFLRKNCSKHQQSYQETAEMEPMRQK